MTSSRSRISVDPAFVGMTAASALGAFGFLSTPFIVGAVADVFASPALGGMAASIEFAGVGLASFGASRLGSNVPIRFVAVIAGLVVIVGQLLTAASFSGSTVALLCAARLLVGLGEGTLYALANAFASRVANPTRAFSLFAFAQVVFGMLTFAIMTQGFAPAPVTTASIFAGAAAVLAPLLLLAPRREQRAAGAAQAAPAGVMPADARRALVALAGFWLAAYLMIPFVERIGLQHGFTRGEIAAVISLHSLPAFIGPVTAAFIGLRLGAAWSILIVIVLESVALAAIMHTPVLAGWSAGILGFTFLMYVFFPLFNGALALIDPSGRAAMLTVTIAAVAGVAGPVLAAAIIGDAGNYDRILPAGIILYALTAVLIAPPIARAERIARTP